MNQQYNGVIQRKLALLDAQVGKLEKHLRDVPEERFVNDWVLCSMAERALQVAVEIMIDIAGRIIALKDAGPVATARDAMARLVDLGVLKSMEPYARMVGLRNMIVHEYESIDPKLLFDLAKNRLDDFRQFRDEIDVFVKTAEF